MIFINKLNRIHILYFISHVFLEEQYQKNKICTKNAIYSIYSIGLHGLVDQQGQSIHVKRLCSGNYSGQETWSLITSICCLSPEVFLEICHYLLQVKDWEMLASYILYERQANTYGFSLGPLQIWAVPGRCDPLWRAFFSSHLILLWYVFIVY